MIRALLFDFDGLLVDTESPAYQVWVDIYRAHGHELPLERWSAAIGTLDGFEPLDDLEALLGRPLERDRIEEARRAAEFAQADREELRDGVAEYLEEAERLGLARAIVSSSSRWWIERHLARLDLVEGWNAVIAADGDVSRAKPLPTLYLEALELLQVAPGDAIAFEDSPNGVTAAKAAGLYCVAVPNPITQTLALDQADLLLESLEQITLADLLERV